MTWKEFVSDLDGLLTKACKLVEFGSETAKVFAPMTGTDAPAIAAAATAASAIATATDAAITAHQAAGGSPQTAAAGLASVAQAVAAQSGNIGISPTTAAQISTMTAALAPEVAQAMTTTQGS